MALRLATAGAGAHWNSDTLQAPDEHRVRFVHHSRGQRLFHDACLNRHTKYPTR